MNLTKLVQQNNAAPAAPAKRKEEAIRKNLCLMFIGTNRTGKSVTAKLYAEKWRANNPNGKILAFDPQDNFADLADETITAQQSDWEARVKSLRNGLLIMDDYKLIHARNTPNKAMQELMNFRAKWNVDCIFVTHSPALVLNYLTYYITHYFIFYTQTRKDSWDKKIPNAEICMLASEYINEYVKTYSRDPYPAFPRFPHIIVTNESDDLTLEGIHKERFLEIAKKIKQQNF